jgi:anti-sigma B factor antagonist
MAYDRLRYGARQRGTLRMDGRLECEIGSIAADGPRLVKVHGEVDLATAPDLEATVRKVLDDAPRGVDLDLRDLTFIDSSGLRSLVAVSKDASARGVPLALRNVPRHAQRVLELTGLDAWFDVKAGS